MLLDVIEWSAFTGVLLGTWLYGNKNPWGPFVCLICAALLVIYGYALGITAMWTTNVIFCGIHARNSWSCKYGNA